MPTFPGDMLGLLLGGATLLPILRYVSPVLATVTSVSGGGGALCVGSELLEFPGMLL